MSGWITDFVDTMTDAERLEDLTTISDLFRALRRQVVKDSNTMERVNDSTIPDIVSGSSSLRTSMNDGTYGQTEAIRTLATALYEHFTSEGGGT